MLKKILLTLSFLFLLTTLVVLTNVKAATSPTTSMVIHYYRYSADYDTGWNVWLWPVGGNGAGYAFDTNESGIVTDSYGAVATIDLTTNFAEATSIGVIMRKGEWAQKDVDKDRFITVPAMSEEGVLHVYFVEGDERIGYSLTDPNGPDKSDKVVYAYFYEPNKIKFKLTVSIPASGIALLINGTPTTVTKSVTQNQGTLTLSTGVDLNNTYTLSVVFPEETKTYDVTFEGIYDTPEFEEAYSYDGNDLGAVVTGSQTTFKLWAPISTSVTLNLYNTGTPARLVAKDATATDTPYQTIVMTKGEKGVWSASVASNLHGKYYTFTVTNGIRSNELVDPYAKSTGVNGLRGMVVDFSQTNPTGYAYDNRPDTMVNYTDAIIYEVHVRDLTSHSSWVVDSQYESYRGKFMGFTVEGTTYNGVSTGIDHIKELGVTHVQILPFFDYGMAVDESSTAADFDWGYMPLNFNTLEGSYSTNPYNGAVRINEFKQLVQTLTNNDLRIVMDVVYNHTGQTADSNFNMILPGYYHRTNADGSFSNGSGTGNETASERAMMQKFMIDSVVFWASEYNISGFRFDLMALHDTETMNLLTAALHAIDPTIIVFGEPWTGGTTPLAGDIAANKLNLTDMPGVAAFNDDIRNGVRGGVFNATEKGFVQNFLDNGTLDRVKYGIVGGTNFTGIDQAALSYQMFWGNNPSQTINYVSAHDNMTLYDKLRSSVTFSQRQFVPEMQMQANAIVLLAEGIPFLHAGEEMLRSKPCITGGTTCTGTYDHNSYSSPDSTNQLRWDLKSGVDNLQVYEYYKDVIAFRKAHAAFRLSTAAQVTESLDFVDLGNQSIIAYTLSDFAGGDIFEKMLIIHNSNEFNVVTLPEGPWTVVMNQTGNVESLALSYASGANFPLMENETVVLRSGEIVIPEPEVPDTGCFGGLFNVSMAMFTLAGVAIFFLRRRFL